MDEKFEETVYSKETSSELAEFKPVLPGLVAARRKFLKELFNILEYMKELHEKIANHNYLMDKWQSKAIEVLKHDRDDVSKMAAYAIRKKKNHQLMLENARKYFKEFSLSLEKLLKTLNHLDRNIERVQHLERKIEISKNIADTKTEMINVIHSISSTGIHMNLFDRLEETKIIADLESDMGDTVLQMEFEEEEKEFLDSEIEAELKEISTNLTWKERKELENIN